MTRTYAALLFFFGPALALIPLLLFFASLDREPPTVVTASSIVVFLIAALSIRVYCGTWYARDKNRHPAWGLLALFGLLGWFFLILVEDHKLEASDRSLAPIDEAVLPERL